MICDDTSSYSADNGQMKDNPEKNCRQGQKEPCVCLSVRIYTVCMYVYYALLCFYVYVDVQRDEEVQASCSAGKLFREVSASLCALRHAHHCVLLSIQSVCLSQPVLTQTFHLNSHRNRINKSPAQTALKGMW